MQGRVKKATTGQLPASPGTSGRSNPGVAWNSRPTGFLVYQAPSPARRTPPRFSTHVFVHRPGSTRKSLAVRRRCHRCKRANRAAGPGQAAPHRHRLLTEPAPTRWLDGCSLPAPNDGLGDENGGSALPQLPCRAAGPFGQAAFVVVLWDFAKDGVGFLFFSFLFSSLRSCGSLPGPAGGIYKVVCVLLRVRFREDVC